MSGMLGREFLDQPSSTEKVAHRPMPGPQYWDWRCLLCGEPVADHPSGWRRLLARVLPPGGSDA